MALKEVGREGGAWGSRGGPGPRVIGGSRFTGGASVFFKYHTSLLFTIGGSARWTASPRETCEGEAGVAGKRSVKSLVKRQTKRLRFSGSGFI